jgi:ABC-type multidrug transport system permease subunit
MITDRSPVFLGDEISTGLDAASTYDMIETLLHFGRMSNSTRVISLLQPSPETVSLFDDIILLGEGRILYAGPIEDVEGYFADLGFKSPEFMDIADFLQQMSTDEGAMLYSPSDTIKQIRPKAPSVRELADIFRDSVFGQRILEDLHEPHYLVWRSTDEGSTHGSRVSGITQTETVRKKYANSFFRSTLLICQRFIVLWTRDHRVIIAGAAKNILMGVSVGGVFASTTDEISIMGALFQAGLFIMLSSMQAASSMLSDRMIYYKHTDANFYSAWPFVAGRTLSLLPQTVSDVILFGTVLYFMVGLAGREDAGNFFAFLGILIMFSLVMQQQLAVIASICTPSGLQIYSSILLLFHILFGGFIVTPQAIPLYWRWMYFWNPFSWAYRALVINEFRSPRWPNPEESLDRVGFGGEDQQYWVAYGFLYLGFYFLECCFLTALGLSLVRLGKRSRPDPAQHQSSNLNEDAEPRINLSFKPVDLSFHDISYDVIASKGKATLRLLNNVNGIFRAGRMCALMG